MQPTSRAICHNPIYNHACNGHYVIPACAFALGFHFFSSLALLQGIAQVVGTVASRDSGSNIVHVSFVGTYSGGNSVALGFYEGPEGWWGPGQVQDDSARVANGVPLLSLAVATDADVTAALVNFTNYATTNNYNPLTSNCGAPADAALANTSAASWGENNAHNNLAIIATTFSAIESTVNEFFSWVRDTIAGWFSKDQPPPEQQN